MMRFMGDVAIFVCITYKTVEWSFKNGPLTNKARISGRMGEVLTIYNVQLEESGYYQCMMKDDKNIFKDAELIVESEFQVIY